MDSTTGFGASLEVNDGAADASEKFEGVTTITLPSEEVGEFEETELAQTKADNTTLDPVRRYAPNHMVEVGTVKCEMKYSAANHARVRALLGKKGKVWKLTPPDQDGTGTTSPLTGSGKGWVKKIDDIVFENGNPVRIKFEVRTQEAWAFALPS